MSGGLALDRANQRRDRAALEEALGRARARVAAASRGGPDWDAAMAAVDELETRVLAVRSR